MATTMEDGLDIIKVVFIAFAPPIVSFILAIAGNHTIDELLRATTIQEVVEKFAMLNFIWILIPISPIPATAVAVRVRIRSRLAKFIAPWLLAVGFVISLYSITYAYFLSFLKEGWREMTLFTYFMSTITTYVVALNSVFLNDD
jgi:hypothetical protein